MDMVTVTASKCFVKCRGMKPRNVTGSNLSPSNIHFKRALKNHQRGTQLHMVHHMRMIRDGTLGSICRFPSQGVARDRVGDLTQQLGLQEAAVQRRQGHAQDLKAAITALVDFHLRNRNRKKASWENHRKTMGKWWFHGILWGFYGSYPLVEVSSLWKITTFNGKTHDFYGHVQ